MTRRNFFKASLATTFVLKTPLAKRKLCFSTLACPKWTWRQIVENAATYGYQGVEIRGIGQELDLTKVLDFQKHNIDKSREVLRDFNVEIVNLNSSAHLHDKDPKLFNLQFDHIKNYIDLALKLDCKMVRVFPDTFSLSSKEPSLDLIAANLSKVLAYSQNSGVKILLDAHGDLVYANDIKYVCSTFSPKHLGVIWDFYNMHFKSKEIASEMYSVLKPYISLIQIKDGFFEKEHRYSLIRKGSVPIDDILKLTRSFDGFTSFEYEKRWIDTLEEPEVSLPDFVLNL